MNNNLFFIIILIAITSLFDTSRELLIKASINALNYNVNNFKKVVIFIVKLIQLPRVWLGFVFSTLSFLTWLFVLSKIDLKLSFSLDSMHYIFIAFASGIFLREKVGLLRWLGTASIVVGIVLVTLS